MKNRLPNLLLALVSVLLVVAFALAADWLLGWLSRDSRVASGLLFPPNVRATYDTYEFTFAAAINDLGFRDVETPLETERATRIVVLGDSFTFGWGVELEQTWVKRLEEALRARGRDVEVLNLGSPGFGPHDYARTAAEVVPVLRPDVVLVGLLQTDDLRQAERIPEDDSAPLESGGGLARQWFPNFTALATRERARMAASVEDTNRERWNSIDVRESWKRSTREMHAAATPEELVRFASLDAELQEAFHAGRVNPILHPHFLMRNDAFPEYELDLQSERMRQRISEAGSAMERIRRVADDNGARVIGLSIPWSLRSSREVWEMLRRLGRPSHEDELTTTVPDEAAAAAFGQAGIESLEVTEAFRAVEAESLLFYTLDTHFNAEGNRAYAELLVPLVEARVFAD